MTGRDLIIFILDNKLEDELVFEDGKIVGFMTIEETAVRLNTGVATVTAWANLGLIATLKIGDTIYIPSNATGPKYKPCAVVNGVEYYVR